jgi:hypothetical protein
MAGTSREAVFEALFALLTPLMPGSFATVTRRFTHPSQITADSNLPLPALMQWEQPEETKQQGMGLPEDTWEAWLVIVFKNPDVSVPGATILNPLLDAVRNAIAPSPMTNVQNLGGLVTWCRVEGTTVKETGDTDTDYLGGAVIPVRMLVP